jgi:hypothetical protein
MVVADTVELSTIPSDVLDLATRNELASYLQPLLTMSRGVFRDSPMTLRVERDAEVESEEHIVIEVDVSAWSVDDMFSAWNRWSEQFCRICPPENSVVFQFRLVQRT